MDEHEYATDSGNVRQHTFNGVTWVDVNAPGASVLERLEKDYHLHPLHLRESLRRVQHNEVEREQGYLYLVTHFPTYRSKRGKITVGQLGVFLGKSFIVTVHMEDAPFLDDMYMQFTRDADKADARSSGFLLFRLIAALLKNMEGIAEDIDIELDTVEDLVFANRSSDAKRIGRLREKIIRLRRLIGPKRLLLEDLADQVGDFAGKDLAHYYVYNVKTVNRLWEEVEEARETVEIYKDADYITSTEQTNNILAILTLVFTFTIPVTVVASLYGMNVYVPGGIASGSWMLFGKYTMFFLVLLVSAGLALAMYMYCRKKGWL